MHGFSDEQWLSYLDGDVEHRDQLEAHLIGCRSCWEFNERMARTTTRLIEAANAERRVFPLEDATIQHSLMKVLRRARGQSAARRADPEGEVRARIDSLREIMTPMCGPATAARALKAAANGSPARSLEFVNEDNWKPFLASLKSIAMVMCGETGAHLVWESGQF